MAGEEGPSGGELLGLVRDGSSEAWAQLVDRFSPMVIAVIRRHRLSEADVDDAYQFVWLRLTEHLDRIRQPEAIGGWLATTARNEALRLARRATSTDTDLDLLPSDDEDVDDRVATLQISEIVATALADLTQRCRDLLRYVVVEQRAYTEVAELMTMPVGSIGPTRQRCLASLRSVLAQAPLETSS